jgi:nicotinate-nucleotide adenylyltransferase
MARYALDHARHLWLVPAVLSPLKTQSSAGFQDRLDMMRCLASDLRIPGRVTVLDIEANRPAPSYTKDTLETLRTRYPEASIALVLGADSAAQFRDWNSPEEILRHHSVLLFQRDGLGGLAGIDVLNSLGARIVLDRRPVPDCASTDIRRRLLLDEKDGSLRDCLSSSIWELIRSRGLYRHAQD